MPAARERVEQGAGAGLAADRDVRRDGGRPAYLRSGQQVLRDGRARARRGRPAGRRSRAASELVAERELGGRHVSLTRTSLRSKHEQSKGLRLAAREDGGRRASTRSAIDVFAHYYRLIEHGETGMIPESLDRAARHGVAGRRRGRPTRPPPTRSGATAVIKLNGGLGTSMGMDRAKSLLCVRRGLSFLDVIARQVLHLRREYGAPLPLIFMNSFRTSADTLRRAGPLRRPRRSRGCRWSSCRTRSPSSGSTGPEPGRLAAATPTLEWCPPGHGDLYTALRGTGLLDQLIDAGYQRRVRLQLRQPRRRPRRAGRRLVRAVRVRRSRSRPCAAPPSDRKGGHFAPAQGDGRIVLRETAQTLPEDLEALADLDRHKYCLHQQPLVRPRARCATSSTAATASSACR